MDMEKLVALCRRRGFIFQSSEIYGGINGFWDYGPLGVELKRNIKDAWWQDMVRNPPPGPDGQEIHDGRGRLRDHHEPEGVGGERARRRVCRPDGRLPEVPSARFRADKVFFAYSANDRPVFQESSSTESCCRAEADSQEEARKLLEEEYTRLVKKKKIPPDSRCIRDLRRSERPD